MSPAGVPGIEIAGFRSPSTANWNGARLGGGASDRARGTAEGLDGESLGPGRLRRINASAIVVTISPFGETGPQADDPATDLTLFFASGIARLLTGQVDDLSEAPVRPVGEQSAFIGGLAAACAGMHAALGNQPGASIDVSIQEALATLAMTELARAGLRQGAGTRKRLSDGNGATVTILPASDGYAAISPREEKQWAAWLKAMGSPAWGADPRFATKADRVKNWDALHALMSQWSRQHDKQWIADTAQRAHVPSFPLREVVGASGHAADAASPVLPRARSWRARTIQDAGHAVRLDCRRRRAASSARRTGRCRCPASACSISAG